MKQIRWLRIWKRIELLVVVVCGLGLHSSARAAANTFLLSPTSRVFSGPAGGPFTPTPQYLTVTNVGTNQLSWTLINTSALFSVAPSSGLLPRNSGTQLVVSAAAPAAGLSAGLYSAALRFTNSSSSVVQTGLLSLNVTLSGIADDFEPSIHASQWASFGGSPIATNFGGSVSASNALWFGSASKRAATTVPIDASTGGQIGFCLRLAYTNADYFDWKAVTLSIPAGAQTTGTQFRWRQLANSSTTADNWALDNVTVQTGSFAPQIVMEPQSQDIVGNDPVTFSVGAIANPAPSYQWSLNGANIAGATTSSLSISSVQLSDMGTYSVLISNNLGTALSADAVLGYQLPPGCFPAPTNLAGWWRAETNATDDTGFNSGSLQGTVGYARGKVGQAFAFSGATGSVNVPNSTSLQLTGQVTLEAWIKPSAVSGDRSIISKVGGAGGNNGYQLYARNNLLAGQFNSPGQSWPEVTVFSGALLVPGKWYHVAWTYDQSAMILYCNGEAVATNAVGAKIIATSISRLTIGNDDSGNTPFQGLIDEASVYSRALSPAEVAMLYAAGNAGKCGEANPATISGQPESQAVLAGSAANFSVSAGGTPPLQYQWRLNGTPISAATGAALVLANLQPADAGTYDVVVTNLFGSSTSLGAVLTVTAASPCAAPSANLISSWAAEGNAFDSKGMNNGLLQGAASYAPGEVGQAFAFNGLSGSVLVPDSGTLRLTNEITIEAWVKAAAIVGDRSIVSKVGGTNGDNGYQLYIRDNRLAGQINTPGAQWPEFTVFSPALVVPGQWYHVAWTYDQSAMKIYCNGSPVATNVIGARVIAATGSNVRIGDDDSGNTPFNGLIDEASIYDRALTASEIAAIYGAGSSGKCPISGTPPSITSQPADQAVVAGTGASFTVAASGSGPLSYQWHFNGGNIAAATNSVLTLANVQLTDAGTYDVLVSNASGATNSAPALLSVLSNSLCVTLPANLAGWWAAESNAWDNLGGNDGSLQGGASYALGEVGQAFAFNGTGSVRVVDAASLRLTNQITVEAWIKTTAAVGDQSILSKVGGAGGDNGYQFFIHDNQLVGQFNTSGQGWPGYRIFSDALITAGQWFHVAWTYDQATLKIYCNGSLVATNPVGAKIIAASASNLRIGDDDSGHSPFRGLIDEASVYSRALSASEIAAIYLAGGAGKCQGAGVPPTITSQPVNRTVAAGGSTSFNVAVTGTPPISYQWSLNGTNLSAGTNATLSLVNVQSASAGTYTVDVSNPYGATNSSGALLTVVIRPQIVSQPVGQTVMIGSNALFSVSASGTAPLAYQWRFNGANIAAATSSSLVVHVTAFNQAGNYSVSVSNAGGAVVSSNALLAVIDTGECVAPPADLVSWWSGEDNSFDTAGTNSGTLQGGAAFAAGQVNRAFSFTATNGSVLVPDSDSLRLQTNLTIEAWIKSSTSVGDHSIVSKVGGAGGNVGYQFFVHNKQLAGQFNITGQSWPGYTVYSSSLLTTGQWYHVAWTYDQNMLKLYCNGVLVGTNVIGAKTIATSVSNLRIGDDDTGNSPFRGLIDEPSIYSRALSGEEIASIYAAGSIGKCGSAARETARPTMLKFSVDNFVLSFATEYGVEYVIEYKDNFTDPQWSLLQGVTGTGDVYRFSDGGRASDSRFYRVRLK